MWNIRPQSSNSCRVSLALYVKPRKSSPCKVGTSVSHSTQRIDEDITKVGIVPKESKSKKGESGSNTHVLLERLFTLINMCP